MPNLMPNPQNPLKKQFSIVSKHKKGLTEVSPINKQRIN